MSTDPFAVALLLFAALLHASWNALMKRSSDPLLALWIMTVIGGLAAGAVTPLVSFPGLEARPWLAASVALHLIYMLLLAAAYRRGDLSQVYPIARGVAPCVVAAMAAAYAGESLTGSRALGTALVAGSIFSLTLGRGILPTAPAVGAALVTGVMIGAYTYVDARGVRASNAPFDFIAWTFFLDVIPITIVAALFRAGRLVAFVRTEIWYGAGGALMATLAYGTVMWAMATSPMAGVAALRETSVIFAALIGTRLLGEPFGARRVAASVGVAAGILLLTR